MKLTIYIALVFALVSAASVSALQTINIESGDTFTIESDAGFSVGKVSEIAATYTIADIGFFDQVVVRDPRTSLITRDITVDAPSGLFTLVVKVYKNKKIVKTEEFLLVVHQEGTFNLPLAQSQAQKQNATNKTTTPAIPIGPRPLITIPRIPDVEAGTTIAIPVTLIGKGTYALEIPRLTFATYDVPEYVTVDGETTVPILLHIDQKTKPGVYLLQVGAGGEQVTTRIRVIQYRNANMWWLLIPLGILLIIIGVLLVIQKSRQRPYEPKRPQPPKDNNHHDRNKDNNNGDLITYY